MTDYKPGSQRMKVKFMQQMTGPMFRDLVRLAKKRQIILTELLRAVIIPEWLSDQKAHKPKQRKKHHPRHASR